MDGRYSAPPFAGTPQRPRGCRPTPGVEDGVELHGPCFVDEGAVVKAGTKVLPYSVIGRQTHVDEGAPIDGAIIWPNGWIGREATVRGADPRPQLPHRPQRRRGRPAVLGDKTVITDYSRL